MADLPLHLQRDPYAERLLSGHFTWRDARVIRRIQAFVARGQADSVANLRRQRVRRTGALIRSVRWMAWNEAGGDEEVFHAQYLYYAKFVELALGKHNPYIGLPPGIPGAKWQPIQMPDGRRRRARPAIPTEMRKQAGRFTTDIQATFSFSGLAMMIYSMPSTNVNAGRINRLLFTRGLNGRTFE